MSTLENLLEVSGICGQIMIVNLPQLLSVVMKHALSSSGGDSTLSVLKIGG